MKKLLWALLVITLVSSCGKETPVARLVQEDTTGSGVINLPRVPPPIVGEMDKVIDTFGIENDFGTLYAGVDGYYLGEDFLPDMRLPYMKNVIYLNFGGIEAPASVWANGGPILLEESGFTYDEIKDIVSYVRWLLKPYPCYVTASADAYTQARGKRIRINITNNNVQLGIKGAAASYQNSYGKDIDAFVFSNLLGYNRVSTVWAITHALGHTLGMTHNTNNEEVMSPRIYDDVYPFFDDGNMLILDNTLGNRGIWDKMYD